MTTLDGTTTATTPTHGTAATPSATDETTMTRPPPPAPGVTPTTPETANGNGATATTAGNGANDVATAAGDPDTTTPATTATTTPEIDDGTSVTTTTPETANDNGTMGTTAGNGANGVATAAGDPAATTTAAAATTTPEIDNGTGVTAATPGRADGDGAAGNGADGGGVGGVGSRKGRRTQRERSAASASRLLDAAIELIATQGFAATTQADIGTRAGYSRAMVRERFGSAEALLDALFERLVDNWHLRVAPLLEGLTGPEALAMGLELFRDRLRERPLEARALFVLQFEAAGPTRSLRDRVAAVNHALTASVATALRDGQADGTVRDDIDPETAGSDWVAQFRGANFLWLVDPAYDLDGFCARWADQQTALFGPSVASSIR